MVKDQEQLKKDVIDHLIWDSKVDATAVQVEVRGDGSVILNGTVPNYFSRQAAEKDAWSVTGISAVDNRLEVKFPGNIVVPGDTDILSAIKNNFYWDTDIESAKIEVTVSNGHVILEGPVTSYWQKLRARELAESVSGVLGIENRLSVVPSGRLNDELISAEVIGALQRDSRVNEKEIDVKVNSGEVTLSGVVPEWVAYEAAGHSAYYTHGVVNVVNRLVIKNADFSGDEREFE